MGLNEFYKKLESFVAEDPAKLSNDELLESLRSLVDFLDSQSLVALINENGLKDVWSLFELRDKAKVIKRELIVREDSFHELVTKRIAEAESDFDALYNYIEDDIYLSALDYLEQDAKKELDHLLEIQLLDFEGKADVDDQINELRQHLQEYEEDRQRVYSHQPHYPFEETEQLMEVERSYMELLELAQTAHSAIKEFLEDEPIIAFIRELEGGTRFFDILEKTYDLFHDVLFKPGLTRYQLLRALQLQGPPVQLANDKCKVAAALMIRSIAMYYLKDEPAFRKEWEEKAPPQFSVPRSSYNSRKGDAKEEQHIMDWNVGEKWIDSIIEFRRYLAGLYKLKHPGSADSEAKSE